MKLKGEWECISVVSGYEIPRKQVHICIATAIHCNYDSNIFTTLNSTHLTVGASKLQKYTKLSTVALMDKLNKRESKKCVFRKSTGSKVPTAEETP